MLGANELGANELGAADDEVALPLPALGEHPMTPDKPTTPAVRTTVPHNRGRR